MMTHRSRGFISIASVLAARAFDATTSPPTMGAPTLALDADARMREHAAKVRRMFGDLVTSGRLDASKPNASNLPRSNFADAWRAYR
jgi:hypothetical protein